MGITGYIAVIPWPKLDQRFHTKSIISSVAGELIRLSYKTQLSKGESGILLTLPDIPARTYNSIALIRMEGSDVFAYMQEPTLRDNYDAGNYLAVALCKINPKGSQLENTISGRTDIYTYDSKIQTIRVD